MADERPSIFPRGHILEVVRRERYPRFRAFRAFISEDTDDATIRHALTVLVNRGLLATGGPERDPYWCRPEDARS